jgi:hypothetical protein
VRRPRLAACSERAAPAASGLRVTLFFGRALEIAGIDLVVAFCTIKVAPTSTSILGEQTSGYRGSKNTIRGMLWTIAVILLILWLLGFSFHIGGGLIHIVLVIVVIVVVIRLVTGRGL